MDDAIRRLAMGARWGKSPLVKAAVRGDLEALVAQVGAGANPEELLVALQRAVEADSSECVAALLDGGAFVVDQHEMSLAFKEAASPELARVLVERGAKVNQRLRDGWTPLHGAVDADIDCALQAGRDPDLIMTRALIELGADPESVTDAGMTIYDVARAYGPGGATLADDLRRWVEERRPQ
jgi:ankyrin repeat protein